MTDATPDLAHVPDRTLAVSSHSSVLTSNEGAVDSRPHALAVCVDQIPELLTRGTRFVVWRYSWRPGKPGQAGRWDKPPLEARTASPASVTDTRGWVAWSEAVAAYRDLTKALDGIGLVLSRHQNTGDGLIAWDLDKCRNPETGVLATWARELVHELNTYAEISPSGLGVRLFCLGQLPPQGRKKGSIECYENARYVTLTGQRLPQAPGVVASLGEKLATIHGRYWPAMHPSRHEGVPPATPSSANKSDAELLFRALKAKNGDLFSRLWDAKTTKHASASEGDMALCAILAFWCGRDAARIDRLFRQSHRMRWKWDERRGDETFGDMTIRRVLEGRKQP
jgi:putative DNA primase/helicase